MPVGANDLRRTPCGDAEVGDVTRVTAPRCTPCELMVAPGSTAVLEHLVRTGYEYVATELDVSKPDGDD